MGFCSKVINLENIYLNEYIYSNYSNCWIKWMTEKRNQGSYCTDKEEPQAPCRQSKWCNFIPCIPSSMSMQIFLNAFQLYQLPFLQQSSSWVATPTLNFRFEGNVWNRFVLFLQLIFVSKTISKFPSKKKDNYNWKHIVP